MRGPAATQAESMSQCHWKTVQTGQFKLDSSCVDSQEYESLP